MSETHEEILIISHYGNIIQNYLKLSTHLKSYRFLMENIQCWQRCGKIRILKNASGNAKRYIKKGNAFQSQRKAMPKNVQTTAQLHSSHMLAK